MKELNWLREIRKASDLKTNPLLETKFAFEDSRWRQYARTPPVNKPASDDTKSPKPGKVNGKTSAGASSASNASNTGASLLQR